jgi:hypothetical protein
MSNTPLTALESEIFDNEWDAFVTRHFVSREVNDIFNDNREAVREGCEIAKYELESPFGGVNAAPNEFGWMPIQPQFMLASSTPTYATSTWIRYLTTANITDSYGYSDWIGSSSGSLNTSKYSTLVLLGFEDPAEVPKVGGVLAEIKAKKYPLWHFGESMKADQHVYELPTPVVIEPTQDIYLQTLNVIAGRDELRPIGVNFLDGAQMRAKNAYAQT